MKRLLLPALARYIVAAAAFGLLTSASAAHHRRVALVVGVANYSAAPGLQTVRREADATAELFRKAGSTW